MHLVGFITRNLVWCTLTWMSNSPHYHSMRMYSIVNWVAGCIETEHLMYCLTVYTVFVWNNFTKVTGLIYLNTHLLILVSASPYRDSVLWTSQWTKFGMQSKMCPSPLPEHCPPAIKIITMMTQMHTLMACMCTSVHTHRTWLGNLWRQVKLIITCIYCF